MAKNKKEKPVLNLDGKDYDIESMTDEQKVMVNHLGDLQNKENSMAFNLDQIRVGKEAFISKLKESIEEEVEEVK
tara:strand:+ start:164 stop:388 length:225 start_codon:yes stop_codon:yes gene_type:complete